VDRTTKTIEVLVQVRVVEECSPDPDAPCQGGDHRAQEVSAGGGFSGVPNEEVAEGIARAIAEAGAKATYRMAMEDPELRAQLQPEGAHEHADGAPTASELDALVGEDLGPGFPTVRTADELAELMAGSPGGIVMMEPEDMEAVLGRLGALLRDLPGQPEGPTEPETGGR
jgi:hypothetical protein